MRAGVFAPELAGRDTLCVMSAVLDTSETSETSEPVPAVKTTPLRRARHRLLKRQLGRARLFRTSAFRNALIYATLFSALTAATLSFIYWSTKSQIKSQVDARLRLEGDYLLNLYTTGDVAGLTDAITRRNQGQIDSYSRFYSLLVDKESATPASQDDEDLPLRLRGEHKHYTRALGSIVDLPPGSSKAFNPVRVWEARLPSGQTLTIGHEITDETALLDHTFALVLVATIMTLLFSLVGGVWIGLSVLRRIDSVSRTASEIMSGDLTQRLRVTDRNDEFDEIATKLNQMLNRIEDLMNSMQQVTNNVAHDLRSPLTRLRNRLEVTLLEERDPENYRMVMDEAIGDADSMIHTFNAMLSIARLEAGLDSTEWRETRIGDLVDELAELYQAVAEEEGTMFYTRVSARPMYYCNPLLIGQALTNLLDNAIKYTPKPGLVSLSVEGNDDQFCIIIADNGPGIPAEQRERVFERFVRLETERHTPGNGLGLSMVKAVVRIHDASLELSDNSPGLRVILRFHRQPLSARKKTRSAKRLAAPGGSPTAR